MQELEINEENLEIHLDWVDEECEATTVRLASYQQRTIAYYNKKAPSRLFHPGNLVLRRVFENITKIRASML